MSLAPGVHLGAYEVLSSLGTGGMGGACGCCRARTREAARAAAVSPSRSERGGEIGWYRGPSRTEVVGPREQ